MSRQFKETAQQATSGPAYRSPEGRSATGSGWSLPWAGTPRRLLARRAIAFAVAGGLVGFLALDGGGYDIVVRQTIAFVVWVVIAIGFATGVLPRGRPRRIVLVPLVAASLLVAWMLLSFGWTASDERTLAELARVLGYGGFAVLAISSLNRYTFRAAAAGLSFAALAIAGIAVASRLAPGAFEGATDVASQFRTDRLDFPLDYWNAIGAWGAMSLAIGLAWSAHARYAVTRALSLAAVPVAGLAVYLSYSRGGVIGTIAAVLSVLILSRNRWTVFVHALAAGAGTGAAVLVARANPEIADATGGAGAGEVVLALAGAAALGAGAVWMTSVMKADRARIPREHARIAVAALVVVVIGFALTAGRGPVSDAWDEFRTEDTPASGPDPAERLTTAGGNRNDIWTSAIDAFESEPAKGLGPGTFEFWWLRESGDREYVRDAHSLYLEAAAELGLPGALLLLAALGGLLAAAVAARRVLDRPEDFAASVAMTSAFCVFLVNAGVDWMWEETAVGVLAVGGVAAAAAAGSTRRSRRGRSGVLLKPGGRAAVVATAVFALIVQIPGIVSTQRVRASEDALAAGDLAGAREAAEDAIDAEPWAAGPHAQLAYVERDAGRLDTAQDEIEAAIEREPENWEWPLVLAPIEAARGNREDAIQTFTSGRRLAPRLGYYSPFSFLYGQRIYTNRQLERIYFERQARAEEGD